MNQGRGQASPRERTGRIRRERQTTVNGLLAIPTGPLAMRILMITTGSHGDVHPFLAVGGALMRRGHSATLLANPVFAELIESHGLRFRGVGERQSLKEQFRANPAVWDPRQAHRSLITQGIGPLSRPIFEATRDAILEDRPDLVVLHNACFAASWAAEEAGVPAAVALLSPLYWLSRHETLVDARSGVLKPGSVKRWSIRTFLRPLLDRTIDSTLNSVRRELNLEARRGWLRATTHGGVLNLALWSEHFRGPLPDDPATSTICGFTWHDAILPGAQANLEDLEAFLAAGPPPILFSLGTAVVHVAPDFDRVVEEAMRLTESKRAILLTGPGGEEASSSKHVWRFPYAPFSRVMPQCAAIVHHGGIGTTAQALRAGRPQIVLHTAHDQPDNGDRIRRLGVGKSTSLKAVRPAWLAEAIRQVTSEPSFGDRAEELARLIRAERDGAEVAADAIDQFLRATRAA